MTVDPRALAELLEESQDLQADAMRPTHDALDELVDLRHSSNGDDVGSNHAFHEEHQRSLRASFAGASLLRGPVAGPVVDRAWDPLGRVFLAEA